jgi:bifunctional non-homologous end joining protein LigD
MALEEYKRKRDFKKTPEPEGKVAPKRAERFFCVQKHLASHLHYDFRLEHNGVLLSWAVPKGPSLDPKTKRLAMHVEDHPVDYGEFEGVIPEGYGAGIVMLWDRGTWTPETDDVDAALKKGDLKFTLDGYKLKGSWVLVRTGGRYAGARGGGDRSWLLIKHRDDWSGDLDITEFAPRSVKSDGDFEDILGEDTPAIWQSHRPAKGGDAGAMLATIIERAAKLKASGGAQTKHARIARTEDTKETKATRDADAKTARAARTEDTKETKGTKGTKGTEGTTDTKRTTDAKRRTKGTKVQRSQGTALKRKKST